MLKILVLTSTHNLICFLSKSKKNNGIPQVHYITVGLETVHLSWICFPDAEVQVGKDQEKTQSEKDSHSKIRGGKKPNQQSGTYTMKTFRKPNEQLFSQ